MDRERALEILKAHEQEFRTAGVASVSLFGSVARGEKGAHDIDLAVRLSANFSTPGLDYFGRLNALELRVSQILDCTVDLVEEPVRNPRLQREIDRDRALAF